MDCDDELDLDDINLWKSMGWSGEQIAKGLEKKRHKETCAVSAQIIAQSAWRFDVSADYATTYVGMSAAMDGLARRPQAVQALRDGVERLDASCCLDAEKASEYQLSEPRARATLLLALAKLLFRDDAKADASALCRRLMRAYLGDSGQGGEDGEGEGDMDVSADQAEDAWYLAGWICIHGDDHTAAYRLWSEGHTALPNSGVLRRQHDKRACWDASADGADADVDVGADAGASAAPGVMVGAGAHGDSFFEVDTDLEAFTVTLDRPCPALSLFGGGQRGRLAFRSIQPVLSAAECANVVSCVQSYHREKMNGVWGTVRQSSVQTTDVAVEDIPPLRPWLRVLLATRLYPMLVAAFPTLADGTRLTADRMRVHDAFIVRYSQLDESWSLPKHSDTSALSFSVALNQRGVDYDGGGTCFDDISGPDGSHVLDAEVGQALAFAGPLRHGGHPISSGERIILVLFLYIEGFPYGSYLGDYCAEHGLCGGSNEAQEVQQQKRVQQREADGYVVYRQTTELMAMLNKPSLA
jgi:hypothetical protein